MAQIIRQADRHAGPPSFSSRFCPLHGCVDTPPMQPGTPGLETADYDFGAAPGPGMPLDRKAIVIDEASFQHLLSARRDATATFDARHAGAGLAALLSEDTALGVFAKLEQRPARVKASLWIVLRDASRTAAGQVQGRDLYVATVPLSGLVPWHGRSAQAAFFERGPVAACEARSRTCVPCSRPLRTARSQRSCRPTSRNSARFRR